MRTDGGGVLRILLRTKTRRCDISGLRDSEGEGAVLRLQAQRPEWLEADPLELRRRYNLAEALRLAFANPRLRQIHQITVVSSRTGRQGIGFAGLDDQDEDRQ